MPVANKDVLFVIDLLVDARIGFSTKLHIRIVLVFLCECHRQFAAGAYFAAEHIGECRSCFAAEIPAVGECLHLVEPRHCVWVAAKDDHNRVLLNLCQFCNQFVLTKGEVV